MNIKIIKDLKQRANEMLNDNYERKIGDEEIYTIICELENFYTAYEKEKEKNKELTERVLKLESDKFWDNVVSKSKIKAKIEELEKEKNIPEEMDFKAFYRIKDLKNIEIAVLQSLLEKE